MYDFDFTWFLCIELGLAFGIKISANAYKLSTPNIQLK